ncbi:MAG: hypothetical protein ACI4EU_06785 [Butyrivibrio sp.]
MKIKDKIKEAFSVPGIMAAASEEDIRIFQNFIYDLSIWSRQGIIPRDGNQDVAYYLMLQKCRLRYRNLYTDYDFTIGKYHEMDYWMCGVVSDPKYTAKVMVRDCERRLRMFRGGNCIYADNQLFEFYQFITYLNEGSTDRNITCCCPNCGAVSTLETLLDGCPYCNTRFLMTDLFPKVTSFNMVKLNEKKRKTGKKMGMPSIIIGMILTIILANVLDPSGTYTVAIVLLMALLTLIVAVTFKKFQDNPISHKEWLREQKRYVAVSKINEVLTPYWPDFSCAHFVNKLVSYLKIIIFTDNTDNLTFYQGRRHIKPFMDIVEADYSFYFRLRKINTDNNACTMTIDVYMNDLHDTGKEIREKEDVFRMTVFRNLTVPEDMGFSIHKVNCHSCGGSFDAARVKSCPYCGHEYDLQQDDWVVLDVEQVR